MKGKIAGALAGLAVLGLAGSGIALAAGHGKGHRHHSRAGVSQTGSRLDDGKQFLPQAKITEQEAIAAAQSRASGPLDEVDLEHDNGRLVWNVDVGASDVKVDATTGEVLAVDHDD
jgi:uncharacterized membrane protein YkoI